MSNLEYSMEIFLKTMSFLVNVPVLSVSKYYILPSSSGIVEFLGIVPLISLSLLMQKP